MFVIISDKINPMMYMTKLYLMITKEIYESVYDKNIDDHSYHRLPRNFQRFSNHYLVVLNKMLIMEGTSRNSKYRKLWFDTLC